LRKAKGLKAAISGKYAKFRSREPYASQTQYLERVLYTDKVVDIEVEELTNRNIRFEDGQDHETKWLKVNYSAANDGPYNSPEWRVEYTALVKELKSKYPQEDQKKPANTF
jgi:hypothetical protein